ncbi:MAG: radical SAM protein [Candidatus Heimdallarchaeota archaeon]
MECLLKQQGIPQGSCYTITDNGTKKKACEVTLRTKDNQYERLIKSKHLSRPEDYYSVYQSGCNHDCLKCHSSEFSKRVNGQWISEDELAKIAKEYLSYVTVFEPKNRVTMWHAEDLCLHCGSCIIHGRKSKYCPGKLSTSDIVLSPQGFGPARNILAFTGGDLTYNPNYYANVASKIKEETDGKIRVLVESNGYALTKKNLKTLKEGGVDSLWLDLKAYDNEIYQNLCGTPNNTVLKSVELIVDLEFTLEILILYIPNYVETDQHKQIAQLVVDVDNEIPITLLAFFPSYKLINNRSPTFQEMMTSYYELKAAGLKNMRLGNLGVFAKTAEQIEQIHSLKNR